MTEPHIVIDKFARPTLVSGAPRQALRWITLSVLAVPELFRRSPRRYIIVLGHMRAGSSLLTQVLANAPEVAGYGETFTTYRSAWALRQLVGRIRLARLRERRIRIPEPVIVDKALFTRLTPSPELLLDPRVRVVFLLREGVRAVQSMVHEFDMDPKTAASYYIDRVASMVEIAQLLSQRNHPRMLIEFETLVADTEGVLASLREFAGLAAPLSAVYTPSRSAGEPGPGDPSQRIRAGRVLKNQRSLDAVLPESLCDRLATEHQNAATRLRELCPFPQQAGRTDPPPSSHPSMP